MYFPSDRKRIHDLLQDKFILGDPKEFPRDNESSDEVKYDKKFSGYHATHYRAKINTENVDIEPRYKSTIVEIQIASVVMHAWAEVEHDLIYKPLSGSLSEEELALLDQINGLSLAGEIALERLQAAFQARISQSTAKFSDHYELAYFLSKEQRRISGAASSTIVGKSDDLLRLLNQTENNSPGYVIQMLEKLAATAGSVPLSEGIMDLIYQENPALRTDIDKDEALPEKVRTWSRPAVSPEILQSFDRRYQFLDDFTKKYAESLEKSTLDSADLTRAFGDTGRQDYEIVSQIHRILSHGIGNVPRSVLQSAVARATSMMNRLEVRSASDKLIRAALTHARDRYRIRRTNVASETR